MHSKNSKHAHSAIVLVGSSVLAIVTILLLAHPRQHAAQYTVPSKQEWDFTIVALPDTQIYSSQFPEIYTAQAQWIVDHKKEKNIVFVTHLGDIVDTNSPEQWERASKAMSILDGTVAYGIAPGNHDMTLEGNASLFDTYFPRTRLEKSPAWGGSFLESQNSDTQTSNMGDKSNYSLFSAGGTNYVALNLEFCPTDTELQWAGDVLETYRSRTAILATHTFIDAAGNHTTNAECKKYQHQGINGGQEMWDYLIEHRKITNLRLILNGHNIDTTTGGARRTDIVAGHPVHQLFSDYQYMFEGKGGYMRIMAFSPQKNTIHVTTYSPVTNTYLTDSSNQFDLSM